jgi:sigma-E factor negative regulatory protein RseB
MLFRRFHALIFTGSLLFFVQPVLANIEQLGAEEMLFRMTKAMKSLNYHGTLVLDLNNKLDAMKLFHTVINGKEQERLLALNSPMREIVRESGKVTCYYLDTNEVIIDHRPARRSFLLDFPEDISRLNENYVFTLGIKEKVAMLTTQLISIEPKDDYRYKRKIWVSVDNFLPLKYQVLDSKGVPLEQVAFTELNIGVELPAKEIINSGIDESRTRHIHRLKKLPLAQSSFVLNNIPDGFHKEFLTRLKMRNQDVYVEHLLLSDGLSTISVYFEEQGKDLQVGLKSSGSTNFFTRSIDEYQVTVMGEVPAKTVKYIAEGVTLKDLKN